MKSEQPLDYGKRVYGEGATCKKNFYALMACILNEKLSVDGALRYMGVSARAYDENKEKVLLRKDDRNA